MTIHHSADAASAAGSAAMAAAKAAPPVVVSGMGVAGVQLNDIVLLVTLVYTLLQLVLLVRDRLKRRAAGGRRRVRT